MPFGLGLTVTKVFVIVYSLRIKLLQRKSLLTRFLTGARVWWIWAHPHDVVPPQPYLLGLRREVTSFS
jgi:hypothetical protein